MTERNKSGLGFREEVRKKFSFLLELGFVEVVALETMLRFKKGEVEIAVYHGRKSFEIGLEIIGFGIEASLSEVLIAAGAENAKSFYRPTATNFSQLVSGLDMLSSLLLKYGRPIFLGDRAYFSKLEGLILQLSEEYALDVLAKQIKPQADLAFRNKDYEKAVDLYGRIRKRLGPVEEKKLEFALKRKSITKENS